MPEPPDFEQLARSMFPVEDTGQDALGAELSAGSRERFVAILRQVWNARGEADERALKAELQRALNALIVQARIEIELEPLIKALDR